MTRARSLDPDTVAESWRAEPAGIAWPRRMPGFSAAVFAGSSPCGRELALPSDPRVHMLVVELGCCHLSVRIDGSLAYEGPTVPGSFDILRAGEAPQVRVTGEWRVALLFMPIDLVRSVAEDLGVQPDLARAVELVPPRMAPDRVFWRFARTLDNRLRRGGEFGRLELDELAIGLAERLVRRHSTVVAPRRRPPHRMSEAEARRIVEAVLDAPDGGASVIAEALDSLPHEARDVLREALVRIEYERSEAVRKRRLQ